MLTVQNISYAQWTEPLQRHMTVNVKFNEFTQEFIKMGIVPQDQEPHIQEIFALVLNGTYQLTPGYLMTEQQYNDSLKPPAVTQPTVSNSQGV